ncbi:MAG: superfamily II DNA/RNA helicase [Sulfurimonas sp.]|jgi:superfamily II DNA/RNA helicase|uniref:hypothetical protein n=1 Tax=Sulfurimonas sp. TaxID=2022749 RepID=UPI0039E65B8E
MSTPTLKRHNHRVHPCEIAKKEELLQQLLSQNTGKKIIVVTSEKSELTTEQENVSIVSDKELYNTPELRCELLISYNLPSKAIVYMSRITKSDSHAIILLDPSEEKLLHPIETLNGRTIMLEHIEGFSEERIEKTAQPVAKDFDPREERKRAFLGQDEKPKKPWEDKEKKSYDDKPRGDKKPYEKKSYDDKPRGDKKPWDKKPYDDKAKGDKKPWEKKERGENKYLGNDDSGKARFSGKSGERNHHFDGTPKNKAPRLTGKTISIKGKTKKEAE